MSFKGNKVWMALDPHGNPVEKNGKVLIKYQLKQDYDYWSEKSNVKSVDLWVPVKKKASAKKNNRQSSARPTAENKKTGSSKKTMPDNENTVLIYTDGASSGNPGPSGIGVVFCFGKHKKEISRYIGHGTNNIAELEAIRTGLGELKRTDLPITVFTDSSYAYGLLVLGWKARKNINLVQSIRKILSKFNDLKFIKVKGHADVEGNLRADYLATAAIKKELSKKQ